MVNMLIRVTKSQHLGLKVKNLKNMEKIKATGSSLNSKKKLIKDKTRFKRGPLVNSSICSRINAVIDSLPLTESIFSLLMTAPSTPGSTKVLILVSGREIVGDFSLSYITMVS